MIPVALMILILWQSDLESVKRQALESALISRGSHFDAPSVVFLGTNRWNAACLRKEQMPTWKTSDVVATQGISTKIKVVETEDGAKWLRDNGYKFANIGKDGPTP